MSPEKKKRLFLLFAGHAAENLTPQEHSELQDCLRSDRGARHLWFLNQDLEVALHARKSSLPEPSSGRAPNLARWYARRPFTAAAAGIVLGVLCTSMVFALVTRQQIQTRTLLSDGFEDAAMVRDHGVPARVHVWSGDLDVPQAGTGEVNPAEGQQMVALPPVDKRKFSYAFRFVDLTTLPALSGSQTRQIEVTAQFHGAPQGSKSRFQIRLAAFAEDAAAAREIWIRDRVDEQALMHVAKTVIGKPADRGWTTARSTMDVPASARLVLVSLAASVADSELTKATHYLDDVQIRIITQDFVP